MGEQLGAEVARSQSHDWYTAGVVATCRWLANAIVRPSGGSAWYVAYAPATDRSVRAEPETIGPEVLAAEKLAFRRPVPSWLADRPGWAEGHTAANSSRGTRMLFRGTFATSCAETSTLPMVTRRTDSAVPLSRQETSAGLGADLRPEPLQVCCASVKDRFGIR